VSSISAATLLSGAVDLQLIHYRDRAHRPAEGLRHQALRPEALRYGDRVARPFEIRRPIHPASSPDCSCDSHPKHTEPTFVPPWKVLPWPEHSPEPRRIKIEFAQPDILVKGLLIDLFV
jgi:hypothetical protein